METDTKTSKLDLNTAYDMAETAVNQVCDRLLQKLGVTEAHARLVVGVRDEELAQIEAARERALKEYGYA